MLILSQIVLGSEVQATDGAIGTVRDLLLDRSTWRIGYLVVDSGSWLDSRRLFLPSRSIEETDWVNPQVHIRLTRQQVTRQQAQDEPAEATGLRSLSTVLGSRVAANDGPAGRVEDFVVDDQTWQVRYAVVNTGNWLPGKRVLICPSRIELKVDEEYGVYINSPAALVLDSPPFDPSVPVNRGYERQVYDYYGLPKYWGESDEAVADPPQPEPVLDTPGQA